MSSPRYAPAGLLVEHGNTRIMFDGGPGATPEPPIAAWLVTDAQAELIREVRLLAANLGVEPRVAAFETKDLTVEPLAVVHTSHPTYGYRVVVDQGVVAWAPEFVEFPGWAAGADLAFVEAAGWQRTIWFRGRVGGHLAALDVAREARNHDIGRLVFAHIGRPTIQAIERGEQPPFGEFGRDGDRYVLDRAGQVRRFRRKA